MQDGLKNAAPQPVSVDIYDQVYNLRGVEPEYIRNLASIVDQKMRFVSSHGSTVDSLRVAVLAALNIADELAQLRQRHNELLGDMDQSQSTMRHRADELNGLLDEVLFDDRIAV